MLFGHRLAVSAGGNERELVGCLAYRQALNVGPGVPELFLPWSMKSKQIIQRLV